MNASRGVVALECGGSTGSTPLCLAARSGDLSLWLNDRFSNDDPAVVLTGFRALLKGR